MVPKAKVKRGVYLVKYSTLNIPDKSILRSGYLIVTVDRPMKAQAFLDMITNGTEVSFKEYTITNIRRI